MEDTANRQRLFCRLAMEINGKSQGNKTRQKPKAAAQNLLGLVNESALRNEKYQKCGRTRRETKENSQNANDFGAITLLCAIFASCCCNIWRDQTKKVRVIIDQNANEDVELRCKTQHGTNRANKITMMMRCNFFRVADSRQWRLYSYATTFH